MDKPEPDYYLDLGISQFASANQVRKAYHLLAKIHHPDKKAPGENIDAAEFRKIHEAYEFLSDTTRRAQYDRRYVLIQRRWTQYRKWEEQQSKAEEKRRAEEEDTKRRAENADMLRKIEEMWKAVEAERLKRQEDAKQARSPEEAEAARQHDESAITPCVHPHIGAVWWKNGKADCSFCGESETYCFRCPVCDVAACHDCREDIVV